MTAVAAVVAAGVLLIAVPVALRVGWRLGRRAALRELAERLNATRWVALVAEHREPDTAETERAEQAMLAAIAELDRLVGREPPAT